MILGIFLLKESYKDLRDVGPNKPMGYLPVRTINELCNTTPELLMAEAKAKGLNAEIMTRNPHSLVVWDEVALQRLLDTHEEILSQANWPKKARAFAEHVFFNDADEQTPLYDLIADSYGDYRNPGRLTLGEPPAVKTTFTLRHEKRDIFRPDDTGWGRGLKE